MLKGQHIVHIITHHSFQGDQARKTSQNKLFLAADYADYR
ncbi:MAG: hypothetical protein ACI9E1_002384 [Cryomorphaceae bacterium]|jgi:hypothetical protein